MRSSADPAIHREREKLLIEHVERLLNDDRLRVDTSIGRRPVALLRRDVSKEDHEVELKRLMAEMGVYDRELQGRMPIGQSLTVTLSRTVFLILKMVVGRLRVISLSPREALIEGREAPPIRREQVSEAVRRAADPNLSGPTTVVVLGTSGFDPACKELATRGTQRAVILVEPNDAGGWTVTGPPEIKALADLMDPEVDADKRARIRAQIEQSRADLLWGGLSAQRIADITELPLQLVEEELKSYARDCEGEGLAARRLDGKMVLFREGGVRHDASGSSDMPFIQRVKALFGRKGDNEKKLSLLAERRAMLSVQRDRAFEEMGVLEQRESDLREQFKSTTSGITKRRITSQLVQLHKDLERRQQLLGMLNQQINVVSTHLHNLELVQQGQVAALPTTEELAADAAAAEEVLASLQADHELAGHVTASGISGMSEEEQALYDELERESRAGDRDQPEPAPLAETRPQPAEPAPPARLTVEPIPVEEPPVSETRNPAPERRRAEPEPG
jgi:hypothetical protein